MHASGARVNDYVFDSASQATRTFPMGGKKATSSKTPSPSAPREPTGSWADAPPSGGGAELAVGAVAAPLAPVLEGEAPSAADGVAAPAVAPAAGPGDANLVAMVAALTTQVGELARREAARDAARSRGGSHGSYSPPSSAASYSERSVCSELSDDAMGAFVGVLSGNPHWHASQFSATPEMERPQRFSLYGNKAFDSLTAGRHEGGGTLGFALGYLEPLCLYLHSLMAHLDHLWEDVEDGRDGRADLLGALARANNTVGEIYKLSNQARAIVLEKARALRAGASEFDKSQAKFVERALDETDFASADVPADIASLKARFAESSLKSSLHDLAKKAARDGGGGGNGGGGGGKPKADAEPKRKGRSGARRDDERRERRGDDERRERRGEGKGKADKPSKPEPKRAERRKPTGGGGTSRDDAGRSRDGGLSDRARSNLSERARGKQPARDGGSGRTRPDGGRHTRRGGGSSGSGSDSDSA